MVSKHILSRLNLPQAWLTKNKSDDTDLKVRPLFTYTVGDSCEGFHVKVELVIQLIIHQRLHQQLSKIVFALRFVLLVIVL